jgi:hypothetical protein
MAHQLEVISYQINLLTERVKILEEKVLRTKRKNTTRAQQMLLLKHSGILETILDFDTTKKEKAIFLSSLLNADPDNLEDDLSTIRQEISGLATASNYNYIIETFQKSGLEKPRIEAEKILKKIPKKG